MTACRILSAAAIYLACQLEDKRKTQAEICKVTGLTEVTLRKVYKELLENWDDLLPSNYTPAVPPERAFPTTVIASSRSSASKPDFVEVAASLDREKQPPPEMKPIKPNEVFEAIQHARGKDDAKGKGNTSGAQFSSSNRSSILWQNQHPFETSGLRTSSNEKGQNVARAMDVDEAKPNHQAFDQKLDKDSKGVAVSSLNNQQFRPPPSLVSSSNNVQFFGQLSKPAPGYAELKNAASQNGNKGAKQ